MEQIKLVALCCQDRSYNAIDVFEGTFRMGAGLGPGRMTPTLIFKAAFAFLLRSLHVDRSPHRPRCGYPVLPKRAWAVAAHWSHRKHRSNIYLDLRQNTNDIEGLPTKFYLLKEFVRSYLADRDTCTFQQRSKKML